MPNINDLRLIAIQKHKAATRKVSRAKAATGVELTGSTHDPRQELAQIRQASPRELSAYVRNLEKFLDRGTQFVPDAHNKPIPRTTWDKVQKSEAKKNAFVAKFYDEFKDVYIDPAGQTVDQRMAAVTPLHAHMGQRTTDSPYKKATRKSTSIYGEAGAKRLIEHNLKQGTLRHEKETLNNHRRGIMKMLDQVGDIEKMEQVAKLTQRQWAILWKYTPFAANIKVPYDHYKDSMAGNKGVINSDMVATDLSVAGEYLDWVSRKDENGKNIIRGRL